MRITNIETRQIEAELPLYGSDGLAYHCPEARTAREPGWRETFQAG